MSLPRAAARHLERSNVIRRTQQSSHLLSQRSITSQCRRTVSHIPRSSSIALRPPLPPPPPPLKGGRGYATVSAAELDFGQPVHETHPHILKPGEITPGITAQEYAHRRALLAQSLPQNGVVILAAADLKYRSGAVFFPYRQESNFMYLTGFLEPEAVAVICRTGSSHGDYTFHLFCRPKDPRAEQWSGPWSGLQAATDVFNADEASPIASLPSELPKLVRSASTIYADLDPSNSHTQAIRAALPPAVRTPLPIQPLVNPFRAIKSPAEVAAMRHAGRISGRALTSAMRRAWTLEKDLHAYLTYEFTQHGLDGPAYVPVVAGDTRGLMIHYVHNTAALKPGTTVLVDAGGEYGSYVTDITRTWPVSGRFSPAQRDLYEAVLTVQRECVALCRANAGLSLDAIHRVAEAGLRSQLVRLGFHNLSSSSSSSTNSGMDVLFPHHVGHYVGLDVHDVPGYARSCPLRKGHCVTVEPGVYVPPDDERWPKHFRGLAVRIEDSVCVDEAGPVVLSTEAVKEVVDIEALRD